MAIKQQQAQQGMANKAALLNQKLAGQPPKQGV
jgi:hypothetical protein